MISFDGEYTREQWSRGIRLAMLPRGGALVLRLIAIAIALGAFVLFFVSYLRGEVPDTARVIRTVLSATLLGLWGAVPYWRAWRASIAPWRTTGSRLSLKGTITEEGISSNASGSDGVDKWESFLGAYIRDDMVVLLGSDGLATILPRTFFASDFEWQAFRHMVEFKVVPPK